MLLSFSVFSPPSSPLTIIITLIIVLGVFLLLGLGVSGSSPQVLRHPTTSMCDSGVNNTRTMDLNTKKGINTRYYKNLMIIVICTY